MPLVCPSFTLVLILFLGAAIHSSPLFLRSFVDTEAPEENGTVDKRSYNTFANVLANGFNFGKIRGKTEKSIKNFYIPREDWKKWKSLAVPMMKRMFQPGLETNYFENGLNIGTGEVYTKNMSKRSNNLYSTAGYWSPRGMKQLMVGGLGGMGGWFLRKSNPNDKDLAMNKIRSHASGRFGVSYGRG